MIFKILWRRLNFGVVEMLVEYLKVDVGIFSVRAMLNAVVRVLMC